eukprot:Sdes_comp14495_c0_seq1m3502
MNSPYQKVYKMLKYFFAKRPSFQDVNSKGISLMPAFSWPLSAQIFSERGIPVLLECCVHHIETHGMDTIGIYRISGNASKVQQLMIAFNFQFSNLPKGSVIADIDCNFIPLEEDSHNVASLLKRYFRELEDCLFTNIHYASFIQAYECEPDRLHLMKQLISNLPLINQRTMKFIFQHLKRVAERGNENKMHADNLSIIFGPTLLHPI